MIYMSAQDIAAKWDMSKRRIQILCKEGRIEGAGKVGNMWVIPSDAKRPQDARTKSPVNHEPHRTVTGYSRNGLKLLLKTMYQECALAGIPRQSDRNYVLSALGGSVICHYISGGISDRALLELCFKKLLGEMDPAADYRYDPSALLRLSGDYITGCTQEPDDLLSWSYQYSNPYQQENPYSKTQFFTEKYMIDFLIRHIEHLDKGQKIVDPCCGGGNFLIMCLDRLCKGAKKGGCKQDSYKRYVMDCVARLHGYDIDSSIAKIAAINIRIKVFSLLNQNSIPVDLSLWDQIKPNIFAAAGHRRFGTLNFDIEKLDLINVSTGQIYDMETSLGKADIVITNPPFETVKGMDSEMKQFLKSYYGKCNCDVCAAFLTLIDAVLKPDGICGIVSQNSWLYLNSFKTFREDFLKKHQLHWIANLGSGAFCDLSGEKSNVALIIYKKQDLIKDRVFSYLDVRNITINEKINILLNPVEKARTYSQECLLEPGGGVDFTNSSRLKKIQGDAERYASAAVPMQGTSTGNAKELIDYFWNHFNDPAWKLVSKGGGYCRWQGLNSYVVKWGNDGEIIKETKGSALRNIKYFGATHMVYSDTGTSGLNVRMLLEHQIFVASGPGIRIKQGNPYAHLAFLNSRIASFYIRLLSPKLTIAAGYIGMLPITEEIYDSVILEKDARLCVDLKQQFLSCRPVNYEYTENCLVDPENTLENKALKWFITDIKNELLKLEIESQMDFYICTAFGLGEDDLAVLEENVGKCAYDIAHKDCIDYKKLDLYLDKHLDACCMLNKSRVSKGALGSDGIVEYAARDLNLNPEYMVKAVVKHGTEFSHVIKKYKNLILHNEVLRLFHYSPAHGITAKPLDLKSIAHSISYHDMDTGNTILWLEREFAGIHESIFKGAPFLKVKNKKIIVESR